MSAPLKSLVLHGPGAAGRHPARIVSCCAKASFSTVRPVCLARAALRQQCRPVGVPRTFARANSGLESSAQKSADAASSKTAADLASKPPNPPADSAGELPLSWDDFFKLRLRRRRIQLVFSVTSSVAGGVGGALLLSTGLAEPLVMQIPLDPFVTLGVMTITCAGMGWLLGPTIGSQVFYLLNRQFKTQMKQKESQFFTRVKKHRVDPSNSSAGNPVPDFYGEKIQSVAGYRRWLKDQRAFNKKKTANFV